MDYQVDFARIAFTTNRLLEFFSEKELSMQIGHDRRRWALALLKELVDNALDACEAIYKIAHNHKTITRGADWQP